MILRTLATLLMLAGPTRADQPATLIGSLTLRHDAPWFGGFSGIDMAPDGSSAVMISDRGTWAEVALTRKDGVLVRAHDWRGTPIADAKGAPLNARRFDAEGLARMPDKRLCVSFEMKNRVDCYAGVGAPADPLPVPREFKNLPPNGGLEALASDDQGRLYAIPEKVTDRDGTVPVYRFADDAWTVAMHLPDQGSFRPSGADIFEDHLYLLLRAFTGIGFRTELIRVPLSGGTMEVLLETQNGAHDNLEGISVWRDPQDRIVASMVSDDNQNWFQRTEIVEYRLSEPPPGDSAALTGPGIATGATPLASGDRTK